MSGRGARPRGRYAPSPTGPVHVGNARTALAAWLSVRRAGGAFVWREEDLDAPRVLAGMAAEQRADLRWLGLDWDEGPDVGGPGGPYRQSERSAASEEAHAALARAGRLFPCRRSRRDLAAIASAPHGEVGDGAPPYPAAWRPRHLDADWYERHRAAAAPDAALRFLVAPGEVCFVDQVQGERCERVDRAVGDFVLKRRDGLYAYQLAVVVDDLRMGIDEVARGADLLASTPRQLQLAAALGGGEPPAYAHVPLLLDPEGGKLSKRDGGATLGALRAAGAAPEQVTGYLAWSLGVLARPRACRPEELVAAFSWQRVERGDRAAPADLARQVLAVA